MSALRVLHVPFCYYPDPVGGTEVYVEQLASSLTARGHTNLIAVPAEQPGRTTHKGIAVYRYPLQAQVQRLSELYGGSGDPQATTAFAALLDELQPDVLHVHAFTRASSLGIIAAAKQRGIRTVFTYHLPSVTCQRGTLLRWGTTLCDGALDQQRCTACVLQAQGLPQLASRVLSHLPHPLTRVIRDHGPSGGLWTTLQMGALIETRHATVRDFLQAVDALVVLCRWTYDLLLQLDIPPTKLALIRHGITYAPPPPAMVRLVDQPLRVAFLGRMYPIKGPDVLIDALRQTDAAVQLDLYGYAQEAQGDRYVARLRALAGNDPRIHFRPSLPNLQVVSTLAGYDLLAVPSQWFETGPLVVLEAFAAGTPVIGSNLGGIAELVHPEIDGLLVTHNQVEAWAAALRRLANDRNLVTRLRAGVRPPRTMDIVADEMVQLYQGLWQHDREPSIG